MFVKHATLKLHKYNDWTAILAQIEMLQSSISIVRQYRLLHQQSRYIM